MSNRLTLQLAATLALSAALSAQADPKVLRLLTWQDYAPADVVAEFEKASGYKVEVTLSNNENIIARLKADKGAFDLAQPSQDRILGPLQESGIYKPMNMGKINQAQFVPAIFSATKKNTSYNGGVYGVPHLWGTEGLLVNTKLAQVADYTDLCRPELKGKVSFRLKRPTLISFAFAMKKDAFGLYNKPREYEAMMEEVGAALIKCKANAKFLWEDKAQLLSSVASGELVAAMMWDTGVWKLSEQNPDIKYIAPRSGATGWVDTFALPDGGKNDEAAYAWINFNMRPEIAARVAKSVGNFTASNGAEALMDKAALARFRESFPEAALRNIKWYPTVPPGLEAIEARILDKVKAAK